MTREEVALAFCREVLGWDDVYVTTANYALRHGDVGSQSRESLNASDLNAVVNAALAWCDTRDAVLETAYQISKFSARVRLPGDPAGGRFPQWVQADDACSAVMAACLAANRRLKAAP